MMMRVILVVRFVSGVGGPGFVGNFFAGRPASCAHRASESGCESGEEMNARIATESSHAVTTSNELNSW